MIGALVGMKVDLEMLKSAFGNALKVGPVEVIDAEKGYRLKLGEGPDGTPYLSPFYPHPESGKTSVPLKKGQIVGVMNPIGDARQGVVFRAGYSDEHAAPNTNMDANVFEDAGVRIEIADGALTITAGGAVITISGDGLTVEGGRVTHNSKNIGADHRHPGVTPGSAMTQGPQ